MEKVFIRNIHVFKPLKRSIVLIVITPLICVVAMVLKVFYKSILHCSVHMVTASIIYIVLPFGSIITIKVYQLTLAKSIFWLCNVKMDITYSKSNIVRINKTVEYCAIQTSTECAGRIISMQLIVKIHTTHASIVVPWQPAHFVLE